MDITLNRFAFKYNATCGFLHLPDGFFCFTLEDEKRLQKIYGQTAIPDGRYEVVLSHSPKLGLVLPELLNVPGFSGIRVHTGNDIDDTKGCILLGFGIVIRGQIAMLRYSDEAVKAFITELQRLLNQDKVFINVVSQQTSKA